MRRMVRSTTVLAVAAFGLIGGGLPMTAAGAPAVSATAGSAVGSAATVASADPATSRARGVCKGVRACKVMGRFDVTGNGRRDQVGLVNRDRDGFIRKGRVTVRVKTPSGRLIRQRVVVRKWRGPVWFGKAAVNGRKGKEIVLGGERRKYRQESPAGGQRVSFAKGFHVITFKPGSDLAKARTPGGRHRWWLTSPDGVRTGSGSAQFYYEYGWWRKKVNGKVRIQKRRLSTGGAAGIQSRKTVWVWHKGRWNQRSSRPMSDPLNKKHGGWHVKGLRVW